MDDKQKNGKANLSQRQRDEFYAEAQRITGFTQNAIRDILIGSFGENFELSRKSEYLELLRVHANEVRSKEALDNRRQLLRNRIPKPVDPNPCPIPGCDGVMQQDKTWAWVCSKGGLRHFLAVMVSEHTGQAPDIALANIESIHAAKQAEQDAELAKWRQKLHEHFEPQGWHILKEEEIVEETSGTLALANVTEI